MEFLYNKDITIWIMAVIVFAITFLLKLPIKALSKKAKNEQCRKAINSVILIIPFAIGMLVEWLYDTFIMKGVFDYVTGFLVGGQSIALYGVVERFFGVKVENPYETEEGKKVLEQVEEITEDGTVTADEIQDFLNNIK